MPQSADKKPETYVGPDGKTRVRMVPVDREVVKSENSQLAKLKLINKIKRSGVVKTGSMSKNEAKDPEESEQLDELTAAELKLINQMYDKKGNLTPMGKKVMAHGKANSKLTPQNRATDNARRKEYNAYQKKMRNENVTTKLDRIKKMIKK